MADTDGGSGGNPFLIYDVNTLWKIAHGDSPENLTKRADELQRRGGDLVDKAKQLRDSIKLLDGHYSSPKAATAMFQAIRDRADVMHDVGSALLGAATLTRSAGEGLADTQREAKGLFENRLDVIGKVLSGSDSTADKVGLDVDEYIRHRLAGMVAKLNNNLYEFATGYPKVPDVTIKAPENPAGNPGENGHAPASVPPAGSRGGRTGTPSGRVPPNVPTPPGGWLPVGSRPSQGNTAPGTTPDPGTSPAGSDGRRASGTGVPGTIGSPRGEAANTAPVGRTLGGKPASGVAGRTPSAGDAARGGPVGRLGALGSGPPGTSVPPGTTGGHPPGGPGGGHHVPPGVPGAHGAGAGGGNDRRQRRTWYEKIEDEFKALEGNLPGGELTGGSAGTAVTDSGPGVLGEQKVPRDEPARGQRQMPEPAPTRVPEGFPDDLKSFTRKDGVRFDVRRPSGGG
ncbi:MAG: hypothetical protein ACRDTU_06865 [Micromonosporaceae bacterium]